MTWLDRIHVGDCRDLMRAMIADGVRVNCIVTSPPYYGLRDYGVAGQIGLEESLPAFLARLVEVFELARQLLADDGTLWLNMGDAHANTGGSGWQGKHGYRATRRNTQKNLLGDTVARAPGLKPKDLMGQPWRLAFALQDAGWYLRRDIIWHKPNPMPESAKDRPTTAHEYLFLMAKSRRYFYDAAAIAEPVTGGAHARGAGVNPKATGNGVGWGYAEGEEAKPRTRRGPPIAGWMSGPGSHSPVEHAKAHQHGDATKFRDATRGKQNASFSSSVTQLVDKRNARSVWTIPTEPFPGAHFATFPRELPRRCILAGSRPGDVVFDPFMGSGTVAEVALSLGRRFIGTELNPESAAMFERYRSQQRGLPV